MNRLLGIVIAALVLTFAPVQLGSGLGLTAARAESTVATVSMDDAVKVFKKMAAQKDIAFHYVADGCFARAHLMIQRMEKMGIPASRVWSLPKNNGKLVAKTPFMKKGSVEWTYHVAPVIPVMNSGKTDYMVIDPSMFNGPVSVHKWAAAQHNTKGDAMPLVRITKLGESPTLANGKHVAGSGYWLGADPPEGPTNHAVKMMHKFKSLEPR
jgi:Glutaminase